MKPELVLAACRAAGSAGTFSISEYAHARSRSQGHSPGDLRSALAGAARCAFEEGRWVVHGPSLDGTEIALFVVLADGALSVV